jgi:hypothetical protein
VGVFFSPKGKVGLKSFTLRVRVHSSHHHSKGQPCASSLRAVVDPVHHGVGVRQGPRSRALLKGRACVKWDSTTSPLLGMST